MADFKKVPEGDAGEGFAEAMGFGAVNAELAVYLLANYWPLILGGILLFLMIVRGFERSAMVVGAIVVLTQAALMGAFARFF